MNVRDSEQVAQTFSDGGYTVTGDEFEADAILVGKENPMLSMDSWAVWLNQEDQNFSKKCLT